MLIVLVKIRSERNGDGLLKMGCVKLIQTEMTRILVFKNTSFMKLTLIQMKFWVPIYYILLNISISST